MRNRWLRAWAWLATSVLLAAGMAAQAQTQTQNPAPAAAAASSADVTPNAADSNAQRARVQPGNNAPMWRAVRNSGNEAGVTTQVGAERGTLIQSFVQYPGTRYTTAGEAWREVRNRWILPYGGSLLLIVLVALALFHFARGPMGAEHPDTGRKIERFTPFERAAHGVNAIAFVVLAVSGIAMAFGKFFLLPVLGSTLFGWLAYALKTLHNFVGPLFAVSLVVVLLTFVKDNFPRAADLAWLRRGGGLFGGGEVPSHRFNAGEKGVLWLGVFLAGFIVVGSGLWLDQLLPGVGVNRADMQLAHMVHGVATVGMMALFFGHIYMGTIGLKGAWKAMRTGWVDEAWAQEHHSLWYDDIKAGKIPVQRSREPGPVAPVATPSARA